MNRLADALIMPPTVTQTTFGALTLSFASADNQVCTTGIIPAVNYPRVFALTGHITILGTGPVATVAVQPLYSLDLSPPSVSPNAIAERVTTDGTYTANMSDSAQFTVPAGSTLTAALGLFSVSGSTSIASGRCHLMLRGQSVTGVASPFDSRQNASEGL